MSTESPTFTDRIVREAERRAITGVSQSRWYELMAKGLAPKPVRIGGRAVGWLLSELLSWVAARKVARDSGVDPFQSLGDAAARVVTKVKAKRSKSKRSKSHE